MLQHFSPFFSGAGDYSLTPLLKGKEDEEEGGYGCHFRLLCFTDEGPCCVLYVQSALWDIDWAQSIVISTVRSSKEMREGGEKEEEETVAGSLFSSFGRSVGRSEGRGEGPDLWSKGHARSLSPWRHIRRSPGRHHRFLSSTFAAVVARSCPNAYLFRRRRRRPSPR